MVSACLPSKFLPASLVQISTAKFGAHNTSDNEPTGAAERAKEGEEEGTKEGEAHHNHSPCVPMQSAHPPAAHLT